MTEDIGCSAHERSDVCAPGNPPVRTGGAAGAHRNAAEWAADLQPALSRVTHLAHQTDALQGYLQFIAI